MADEDECVDDDYGLIAPASPASSEGSDYSDCSSLDSNCSTISDDDEDFERERELAEPDLLQQEEHQRQLQQQHQQEQQSSCHHFHQQTPVVYEPEEMTVLMPQPLQPQFHPQMHQEYFAAQHYSGPVPVMPAQTLPPIIAAPTAPVALPPPQQQQHHQPMVVCAPPSKVPLYPWDIGRQFVVHHTAAPTSVHPMSFYHPVPMFNAFQAIF
jgi:hypothetical protein